MRVRLSLRSRLFAAFALVTVVAVATFSLFVTRLADRQFDEYEELVERLQITRMAQWLVGIYEISESWEEVQPYVEEMHALSGTAILVADARGRIVGDSRYTPAPGPPPANWAEYPLVDAGGLSVGTLYVSGARTIQEMFRSRLQESLRLLLYVGSAVGLLVALGVSSAVAGMIASPVRQMSELVRSTAQGDFTRRMELTRHDELGDLADAFNRMSAELDTAFQRQRNLVADTAHELRTPLTNVRGYLEALQDGVMDSSEALPVVREEVGLLQRIVEDLQVVAVAESGNLSLQLRTIAVPELLSGALSGQSRALQAAGVSLVLELSPDLPEVIADPQRVGQIVSNILHNALRYTPAGASIAVGANVRESAVEISIQDSGEGIPPEQLPHIFDRFYRVDPSRSRGTGGSGLGLTIARLLAESQGGTISAENVAGGGSRFAFTLPIAG